MPAFPGAEGYGAKARGGRGGRLLRVTSLGDFGPGTLRWALEDQKGPRIIIFDISGTIQLSRQILIEHGDVTVAGQTAPGHGIVITGSRIRIKASEVIVQGVRFRPGDGAIGQPFGDRDALMIGTTDFPVRNIVIDRNSFAWAIDENVAINGKVENLTFSNNIVAEALSHAGHPKGEHSKGLLVSNWAGTSGDNNRISIIKNIFTSNRNRNPEVNSGLDIEVINNTIFNYGFQASAISLGGGHDKLGRFQRFSAIVAGNAIIPGNSTVAGIQPVLVREVLTGSVIAVYDNEHAGTRQGDLRQTVHGISANEAFVTGNVVPPIYALYIPAHSVEAHVLQNAGARSELGLDPTDSRIISQVKARSGAIIDRPIPITPSAQSATTRQDRTDSDLDGMPDWFERHHGTDSVVPDANADQDRDGFTNIEEFLHISLFPRYRDSHRAVYR